MIATKEIKEGVFLISWLIENPTLYKNSVSVMLSSYTFVLSFRKCVVGHVLCMAAFNKSDGKPAFPVEFRCVVVKKNETEQQNMKRCVLSRVNQNERTYWVWRASWPYSEISTCPTSFTSCSDLIKLEIVIDSHLNCPDLLKTRKRLETIHQTVNLFRENEAFGDVVTFQCENQTIKGHPSVLAASSPVFSAMFKHEFKEKLEKFVSIEDVKANVFEQLVQYLYIQDVDLENIEDVAELLVAADKYCVDSLKGKCGLYLSENLTMENSIRRLVLAHLHQVPKLKEAALSFIVKHVKGICDLHEDWMEFVKNYPELIIEITKRMAACMFMLSNKLDC